MDAMLDAAADVFATDHVSWVPVLDGDRKLVGVVTIAGLVESYRDALDRSVTSLGAARFVEGTVAANSPLAGSTISELPHDAAVISLERDGASMVPRPELALKSVTRSESWLRRARPTGWKGSSASSQSTRARLPTTNRSSRRHVKIAPMGTSELLGSGHEAFASQDWAGTIEAFGSAGALPPDASEDLAKA